MGIFNYNNPVIKAMVKIANMMIVSFYWVICCLPLVTILPACAGLYHATTHAVFKDGGGGVTKAFFTAFKDACRQGLLLSLVADILAVLIYLGIITGLQTWEENLFWAFYLAAGLFIAFLLLSAFLFLGPVLSRFSAETTVILRLAFYFSGRHILGSVFRVLLLALMVYLVSFFPLLLLIVPALYTDLIHGKVEKSMEEFITSSQLEEKLEETHGAEQK